MTVDCASYRDGRRADAPTGLAEALAAARATGDAFLWIDLHEPTAAEFEQVSAEFGLHPLAVEDAVRAHQRPKVEHYRDTLFVVLKTVRHRRADRAVDYGELMLFLGDSFLLTVRHGAAEEPAELPQELLRQGPGAVLYALCARAVDGYLTVAGELQGELDDVEAAVFAPEPRRAPPVTGHAERIYGCKRQLLAFRRAVAPLAEPVDRLAAESDRHLPEEVRPYLRNLADQMFRANEQVEALDRRLSDILDAHLAQVGVRQNNDARKISAWAALVALPTVIAGVYGMRFDNVPELHTPYGYAVALAGMAGLCAALHRVFRRAGWL